MKVIKITIEDGADGLKIDKALLISGVDIPRKEIRRILDKGGIQRNGKRVFVASQTVKRGDQITLSWNPAPSQKKKISVSEDDILYWKHGILAVNKAPGLVSVPTVSAQTPFVKKLLVPFLLSKGENPDLLTACHRLDKETSGVLLFALGKDKAHWIMDQFKNKGVKKVYYAICYGIPKAKKWEVTCHLSALDKRTGMVKVVRSGGYASSTSFQLIAVSKIHGVSLLRVEPRTGRSHQIRVHLLHCLHPIIGDKKYSVPRKPLHPSLAELTFEHQFLHAASIEFSPAPGEKRVSVQAPLPELFHSFVKKSQMEFLVKDPAFFS